MSYETFDDPRGRKFRYVGPAGKCPHPTHKHGFLSYGDIVEVVSCFYIMFVNSYVTYKVSRRHCGLFTTDSTFFEPVLDENPHLCKCTTTDLLNYGCRCGGT